MNRVFYLHFEDEETEAQRILADSPSSHTVSLIQKPVLTRYKRQSCSEQGAGRRGGIQTTSGIHFVPSQPPSKGRERRRVFQNWVGIKIICPALPFLLLMKTEALHCSHKAITRSLVDQAFSSLTACPQCQDLWNTVSGNTQQEVNMCFLSVVEMN